MERVEINGFYFDVETTNNITYYHPVCIGCKRTILESQHTSPFSAEQWHLICWKFHNIQFRHGIL